MFTTATVKTEKAERYMKALCNHFSRKVSASYEGNIGSVDFGSGSCMLEAKDDALILKVESDTVQNLTQLEQVMSSHLIRFTQNEILEVKWIDEEEK